MSAKTLDQILITPDIFFVNPVGQLLSRVDVERLEPVPVSGENTHGAAFVIDHRGRPIPLLSTVEGSDQGKERGLLVDRRYT